MTILIPAVLSTKQCHDYVGGSRIWEELQRHHGDKIKPLRTLPRGDSHYLRQTVDNALMLAEASGSLVHTENPDDLPVLKKSGRRFRSE